MNLKNKTVLVTGADGFIGSHLVEKLHADGAKKIKAISLYNSFGSWGWLDTLDINNLTSVEVITGDVRDPNFVRSAMKNCDIVFHLAALIAIPYSYLAPDSYVDTNVKGTLNVLQAARDLSIERLLVTSTSEVYGTAIYVPIDESHPLQAQSPYSATKIAADKLAESFHKSFSTPITIVRPFNTYGPRQSARAIIPTIISQLLNGSTQIKVGSIKPTRDFNYVEDIIDGFCRISCSEQLIGKEVNIASGVEISIEELVHTLINKINPLANVIAEESRMRPENSEVERLIGNSQLLRDTTGWANKTNLDTGLDKTIEWFAKNENLCRYKSSIYNI